MNIKRDSSESSCSSLVPCLSSFLPKCLPQYFHLFFFFPHAPPLPVTFFFLPFLSFPSSFFPFLLLLLYVVHCPRHEGGESTSNAPLGKSGKIRRRRQSWLMQCCTPRHCSRAVDTQQTQCGNNKTVAMWQYGAMWQY